MSGDKRLKVRNPAAIAEKQKQYLKMLEAQLAASTETLEIMQGIAAREKESPQVPQDNNNATSATSATNVLLLNSIKNNVEKDQAQPPAKQKDDINAKNNEDKNINESSSNEVKVKFNL